MDNDDQQVGRILSRREVLALIGVAGMAPLAGCAPASPTATGSAAGAAAGATAAGGEALASTAAPPLAATAPSGSLPSCVVRPELTEGPYFVDEHLVRSDIRSDPASGKVSPGTPLVITLAVSQVDGSACKPLGGVTVDLELTRLGGHLIVRGAGGAHHGQRTEDVPAGVSAAAVGNVPSRQEC